MEVQEFSIQERALKKEILFADFVIIGGGLAGVCAAITAARNNTKVILVQDRPVLGGNTSSEIRLWALGATSHMGNNNRWSREGGVIDEILVENLYRNPEGNPVLFEMVLIDKVLAEENITLLLNTSVYDLKKKDVRHIAFVKAFNCAAVISYEIHADLFCDASGDGIVSYMAGASYRVGAEEQFEFGEKFVTTEDYGQMLGHSLYFYSKDAGKPVKYVAPNFALKDITEIPRYRNINAGEHGCKFWWLEYGARLDTVHDNEKIKYELWRIVYGVWDYIKNSGNYQDVENLTLEWVGIIPGKRESRRFNGLYMINQNDIIFQHRFDDAIAFGGWAIDLHPADGVYSPLSGCTQYHSKGVYSIPYRVLVCKDIDNLFLAGRIISASHIAFGSTRVMATSAFSAQAVGVAASMCRQYQLKPADIVQSEYMKQLQQKLNLQGQSIPFVPIVESDNLASKAQISANSVMLLDQIAPNGGWKLLDFSAAQLLPMHEGDVYEFEVQIQAQQATSLVVELCTAERIQNYTPDKLIDRQVINLVEGEQNVCIRFAQPFPRTQYGFVCFMKNEAVFIRESKQRMTGLVSVFQKYNKSVAKSSRQEPPEGLGIDAFDFWVPERRPQGFNLAMKISPIIACYTPENVVNGYVRPFITSNAWVAGIEDENPQLTLKWKEKQLVTKLILFFDTDYDHAMENVQMGHPERIIPFCVQQYQIVNEDGTILYETTDNYQTVNQIKLKEPVYTSKLTLQFKRSGTDIPVSLFEIVVQ